jgi:hypothetical protein
MSDEARYYQASREARRAWEHTQPQLAFDLWGLDEHQAAKAPGLDGDPGKGSRRLMLVEPVTDRGVSSSLPRLLAPTPPVAGSPATEENPAPAAELHAKRRPGPETKESR